MNCSTARANPYVFIRSRPSFADFSVVSSAVAHRDGKPGSFNMATSFLRVANVAISPTATPNFDER